MINVSFSTSNLCNWKPQNQPFFAKSGTPIPQNLVSVRIRAGLFSLDRMDFPLCPTLTKGTLNNFSRVLFRRMNDRCRKVSFVTQLAPDIRKQKIRKIYRYKWVPVARGSSKVFNSREPIERRDLLHKLKATVNSHDETQLDLQILSKEYL